MNLSALNGSPLNGGGSLAVVLATAALLCTADCSANATYAQRASAAPEAAATIVATGRSVILATVAADAAATVGQPAPIAIRAGAAALDAAATIAAAGSNYTKASASLAAAATVLADVGASFSSASPQGAATLVVTATQLVYAGIVAPQAAATFAVINTKVIKPGEAAIPAAATIYADAGISGHYQGTATLTCGATFNNLLLGIVIQRQEADVECAAYVSAAATQKVAAQVSAAAVATITANGSRTALMSAAIPAAATITAPAGMIARLAATPSGGINGAATFAAIPTYIRQAASADIECAAGVVATSRLAVAASAFTVAWCEASANGGLAQNGSASIACSASVFASGAMHLQTADPADRTMHRPQSFREMSRPFVDRTMKAPVV